MAAQANMQRRGGEQRRRCQGGHPGGVPVDPGRDGAAVRHLLLQHAWQPSGGPAEPSPLPALDPPNFPYCPPWAD